VDKAKQDHSSDSDKSDHHDSSFCDSLHSTCLTSTTEKIVKPDFAAFIVSWFSAAAEIETCLPEAPASRQPPDRKWVFTPEVCLGPAFRCHAPPVSSLI
jgi:hypothetical protein